MSKNSSLLAQVLKFSPKSEFVELVHQHKAEYKAKGFSCWQQFVSMLFCRLSRVSSLLEIVYGYGLQSCVGKLQHFGNKSSEEIQVGIR